MRYAEAKYYAHQSEKLFFNAGSIMQPDIIDELDKLEQEIHGAPLIHSAAIKVQKVARGFLVRRNLHAIRKQRELQAAIRIQCFARAVLARRSVARRQKQDFESLRKQGKARRRVVTVKVCGASGLASAQTDAYCAIYYKLRGHARIKIGQTTTARRTDSPEWRNQVFEVVMPRKELLSAASVTAVLYDKSARRSGEFLGRVRYGGGSGQQSILTVRQSHGLSLQKDPKRPAKQNANVAGAISLAISYDVRVVDVPDTDLSWLRETRRSLPRRRARHPTSSSARRQLSL